jgi:hypothetical protein
MAALQGLTLLFGGLLGTGGGGSITGEASGQMLLTGQATGLTNASMVDALYVIVFRRRRRSR